VGLSGKSVLNSPVHEFDEGALIVELPQLLLKLWREQIEKFGIAGDERCGSVGGAKEGRVTRSASNEAATEVSLNCARVFTLLDMLNTQWVRLRFGSGPGKRYHLGKAEVGENRRLIIDREQPSESNTELFFVKMNKNFFRWKPVVLFGYCLPLCSSADMRCHRSWTDGIHLCRACCKELSASRGSCFTPSKT
jgi:hypothetical protein